VTGEGHTDYIGLRYGEMGNYILCEIACVREILHENVEKKQ